MNMVSFKVFISKRKYIGRFSRSLYLARCIPVHVQCHVPRTGIQTLITAVTGSVVCNSFNSLCCNDIFKIIIIIIRVVIKSSPAKS